MRVVYSILVLILGMQGTAGFTQETGLPVEIRVTGKQPGPPLWKVSQGDNTLWIFAYLSPIPRRMDWESKKVEEVIAGAEEYISLPEADVSVSPLMMLNPINIFRGMSLSKRLTRNEDKARLEDVLTEDQFRRFQALKTRYFPGNKKIEKMRPMVAGSQMVNIIEGEENLVSGRKVLKKINRLVKRNKDIKTTEIKYEMRIEGKFRDIADRVETLFDSITEAREMACFEFLLQRMEEDVDEMKYRADTWAMGYVDEFRYVTLPGSWDDLCIAMFLESSEQNTMEEILGGLRNDWLAAAEKALQNNRSTFAVLNINQMVESGGWIDRLRSKGYEVKEP